MEIELIASYFLYGLKIMSNNTLSEPQPDSASYLINNKSCIHYLITCQNMDKILIAIVLSKHLWHPMQIEFYFINP